MSSLDNFYIEIDIKKNYLTANVPVELKEIISKYKQHETGSRIILDIPHTWQGFRDGTIVRMFRFFGEKLYTAIAYMSDKDDIVVDFEGKKVDNYEVVIDGVRKTKYVKKRLRIIDVRDKNRETFHVQDYILNMDYFDPIVKIMDVYCTGPEAKFKVDDFIAKE